MGLVSVLIATYHRPEFIEGAIETALKQTYDSLEVVVVNDDSSDRDTTAVLNKYDSRSNVKIVHNDVRTGLSASRNQAAREANGKYLCILDDDDRWVGDKIERQVQFFESLPSDYAVVYTGGEVWSSPTRTRVVNRYNPPDSRKGNIWPDILVSWRMDPHSGHMIKRSAFESVSGFDESLDHGEDWDLSIRLAKEYRFEAIAAPLTIQLSHEDNVSHRQAHIGQRKQILSKYFDEIFDRDEIRREFFAEWHEAKGFWELQSGNRHDALRCFWLSLGYSPNKKRIVLFLLSALGQQAFRHARKLRQYVRTIKSSDKSINQKFS